MHLLTFVVFVFFFHFAPLRDRGFPVGFQSEGKSYLHNHLRITVAINPRNEEKTKFHVVSFSVCFLNGFTCLVGPKGEERTGHTHMYKEVVVVMRSRQSLCWLFRAHRQQCATWKVSMWLSARRRRDEHDRSTGRHADCFHAHSNDSSVTGDSQYVRDLQHHYPRCLTRRAVLGPVVDTNAAVDFIWESVKCVCRPLFPSYSVCPSLLSFTFLSGFHFRARQAGAVVKTIRGSILPSLCFHPCLV